MVSRRRQGPSRRNLPEDDYAAFVATSDVYGTTWNPLKMQFAGVSFVGELAHFGNSPNLWH
jgi:hypothetical protein